VYLEAQILPPIHFEKNGEISTLHFTKENLVNAEKVVSLI